METKRKQGGYTYTDKKTVSQKWSQETKKGHCIMPKWSVNSRGYNNYKCLCTQHQNT